MTRRSTDGMSQFDMRQLLLFDDLMRRYEPLIGRATARRRAADEMPLAFDSPTLETAARRVKRFSPPTWPRCRAGSLGAATGPPGSSPSSARSGTRTSPRLNAGCETREQGLSYRR